MHQAAAASWTEQQQTSALWAGSKVQAGVSSRMSVAGGCSSRRPPAPSTSCAAHLDGTGCSWVSWASGAAVTFHPTAQHHVSAVSARSEHQLSIACLPFPTHLAHALLVGLSLLAPPLLPATPGVLLGFGSYGRVFQGRWHGKDVAIKIIHCQPEQLPRVLREAEIMLQLDHPNVCAPCKHALLAPPSCRQPCPVPSCL